MKHIAHIRKSYPRFDRHGGFRDACADLAAETGADDHQVGGEFVGIFTRSVWSTRDTSRRGPHDRRGDGQPFEKVASADVVDRFPVTGHVLTNVGAERS